MNKRIVSALKVAKGDIQMCLAPVGRVLTYPKVIYSIGKGLSNGGLHGLYMGFVLLSGFQGLDKRMSESIDLEVRTSDPDSKLCIVIEELTKSFGQLVTLAGSQTLFLNYAAKTDSLGTYLTLLAVTNLCDYGRSLFKRSNPDQKLEVSVK